MRTARPRALRGRAAVAVAVAVAAAVLVSGCGSGAPDAPSTPSPADPPASGSQSPSQSPTSDDSAEPTTADAVISEVSVEQWANMTAAGMVRPGCAVTQRDQLRRIDINYVDFSGAVQRGHLVAHADTAESLARIFTGLFDQRFPIASMTGVEAFGGDSNASLRANNTASYNCRRPDQINAPPTDSPHANGRAVDINPVQNPWVDLRCDCWSPGPENRRRTPGPGKILRNDAVYRLFIDEGWIWQNIRVADYMHFDTGYPSVPYVPPEGSVG